MKYIKRSLIGLASVFACATATAQVANVPINTTFQGRLVKPDGTPVSDTASQSVTFRLYSAASGGTLLWQQVSNVAVRNGAFAVTLNFFSGYSNGYTFANVFLLNPYWAAPVILVQRKC